MEVGPRAFVSPASLAKAPRSVPSFVQDELITDNR